MTIFQSARLKLTGWYLLLIMLLCIFFSGAFYRVSTRELHRLIDRIKFEQEAHQDDFFPPTRPIYLPSIQVLQNSEHQLLVALVIINGIILIFSGAAAYFLAGRTLKPIKTMVDEQNQFISSSSHELRTPIATLRAEMEGSLLEKNITDRQARGLINSNLEELGRLQILTNNLLRLAQNHDAETEKYFERISLKEVIVIAQKRLAPLAKSKKITVVNETKEAIVSGDKNSLVELFVILLDNAIKYSSQNSKIKIATEIDSSWIKVLVSDKGMGISKEDLPHIFDRFYRAEKSRSHDGFGLGLSIAKKIVENHGGLISVKSETNKGTTFLVELPQYKS